jgi:hypothetical protein
MKLDPGRSPKVGHKSFATFFCNGPPNQQSLSQKKRFSTLNAPTSNNIILSPLERAQFYYWNLFSTTSTAWCCCFGVWAPQLTVSTSHFNSFLLSTYGCSSSMPFKLLFRHLRAWKHDRQEKLHDFFIIFLKHMICSAVSQYLSMVGQQGD